MSNLMVFDQQPYDQYTVGDQEVWSVLFNRQMCAVKSCAYHAFAGHVKKLDFHSEKIPDIKKMNVLLQQMTRWTMYPLPGLLTDELFFRLMNFKKFGVRTTIRKKTVPDADAEPDLFSDVFGHAPLLADPLMAAFVLGLARIAERYVHVEAAVQMVYRLYGYTVESGLIREGGEIKVYGGQLLSSTTRAEYALSTKAYRQPFNLDLILNTAWELGNMPEQFFVLDSFVQLKGILKGLDYALRKKNP